jgi:hypothetical protein
MKLYVKSAKNVVAFSMYPDEQEHMLNFNSKFMVRSSLWIFCLSIACSHFCILIRLNTHKITLQQNRYMALPHSPREKNLMILSFCVKFHKFKCIIRMIHVKRCRKKHKDLLKFVSDIVG